MAPGTADKPDYQSKASAWLRYSNSSVLSNHRLTSYSASCRLPEACTRLATALPVVVATNLDWCAKSPRIEPGCASFGYVEPTILRTVATASDRKSTRRTPVTDVSRMPSSA